jgi:hypothetical protein
MLAKGVNRLELPIYRTTNTDVTITDSRGHKETYKVCFVVTDLKRYKMYLGLLWIN